MIASMTAFARQSHEANWGALTWEIRTVNHRYLEISLRLPDFLRDLEQSARDTIQKQLHRGKIEAMLRFQPGQDIPFDIMVNQTLTQQLANASKKIIEFFPAAHINTMDVLSWPGVLQTKKKQTKAFAEAVITLLRSTLEDCVITRQREGDGLKQFIEARLAVIQEQANIIKKQMPAVLKMGRKKMLARFEELSLGIDKERLEQEMVWVAQKVDIAEELQRLTAHVIEVKRIIKQGGVVGRRLDFLMQELNREANTLGSKSVDTQITQAAVELKVQIEQIREQVQNIE